MRRLLILVLVFLIGQSFLLFAKEKDVGTTGGTFLKIGQGARAISMGGAFVALSDDASSLYWNPAGLGQIKKGEVSFTYLSYFQDISRGNIGYVQPTRIGTFGIDAVYLRHKDIPGYDVNANPIDDYSAYDVAVSLSYGKDLGKTLFFGGNCKYIIQRIEKEEAQGYAFSLGVLYKTFVKDLNVGLVVQNLGSELKFVKEGDSLPLVFKFGTSYKLFNESLALALDIRMPKDNEIYGSIGGEYWIKKVFALRAGYNYKTDPEDSESDISGGIGFRVGRFGLDYAYVPYGDLGDTHRASFTIRF